MGALFAFVLLPLDSPLLLGVSFFLVIILTGVGLPIPEELLLLFAGYLAYLEFVDYWFIISVLIVSILIADVIGYVLGRYAGDWISQKIFNKFGMTRRLLAKTKEYFDRYGEKVVFLSRPLAGVRAIVPILAGHFRMNFKKFFWYDVLAAIPWTFLLVTISYYLGTGFDLILKIRTIKHDILVFLGIVILIGLSIKTLSWLMQFVRE